MLAGIAMQRGKTGTSSASQARHLPRERGRLVGSTPFAVREEGLWGLAITLGLGWNCFVAVAEREDKDLIRPSGTFPVSGEGFTTRQ